MRAIHTQVRCEGLPDIDRQGHPIMQEPLTSNEQLLISPVNVFESEGHYLSGTQAEAGQQEKDGVIAAAGGGLTVAGAKHPFNLIGAQVLGYGGQAPIGDGGRRKSKVDLQFPVLKKEVEERKAAVTSCALRGLMEGACRKIKSETSDDLTSRMTSGFSRKHSIRNLRMHGR